MVHTANFSLYVLEEVFAKWLINCRSPDLHHCDYSIISGGHDRMVFV
jgi:hypothetical protein